MRVTATQHIRLVRDEAGTVTSLDTAIVRYERGEGKEKVVVDGIGAIHIADKGVIGLAKA